MRALAVLAVMAYHDDASWARGGFLGVDAFFVLSGFLITTLLVLEFRRAERVDLASFWTRRARRLLPALLLVLVFVAFYSHELVATWDRTSVRDDAFASLGYVANWRFILARQSYFELFSAASPLRHMWSLAIEEQFYLVWPLVVFACLRFGRGSVRPLAAVCGAGALASAVAMRATYHAANPSRAYYGTDARAHTLLIGALLAVLLLTWTPSPAMRRAIGGLGVIAGAAVVVSWTRVSGTDREYYRGGSVLYALAVALVVAAALQPGPIRAALSTRPLVWIGTISYGLYLWHWPIDVWLTPDRLHASRSATSVVRLVTTFAFATASFYLLERPIRSRVALPRRTVVAFVSTAVLVAGAVLAGAAGATPPPTYLRAFGHPSPCRAPSAAAQRTLLATARRAPVARPIAVHRILLVGDSIGCSFYPGLSAVAAAAGMSVDQGSVVGCGVVSNEVVPTRGEQVLQGTTECRALVEYAQQRAVERARPDVVIWLSQWERMSVRVGGTVVVAGTQRADALLLDRMQRTYQRLIGPGARLVLLTVAPSTIGSALGVHFATSPERARQTEHLNTMLRRFAARHPGRVTVVDLARRLCPQGPPCPPLVDGRHPRPDGAHFDGPGSEWAARWVLAQLAQPRGS